MGEPRFANILLSGPCNLRCPACIGSRIDRGEKIDTLDLFPLPGLENFIEALKTESITQLSLTGIDTEPMLYRHQDRLLTFLRENIAGIQISLHTNGTLILRDPDQFNRYDRATISIPSLKPETCLLMTGSSRPLDLEKIISAAKIPVKISTLVTDENIEEIPSLVRRFRELGIKRVVLRELYGGTSPRLDPSLWTLRSEYAGNPVYDFEGTEVTIWNFERTSLCCLNLFPDGRISPDYLLQPPPYKLNFSSNTCGLSPSAPYPIVRHMCVRPL